MKTTKTTAPTTLDELRERLTEDGVEYILAQFVNIHGSAKVKMVPARNVDDILTDGAGFAGGAVWGVGQKAHSHDIMGRGDPSSYTPIPWQPGLARLACDLYVDDKPHPYCSRVNLKRVLADLRKDGYIFNVGMEPEFFLVRQQPDGGIVVFDDQGVDTLDKPCYDFLHPLLLQDIKAINRRRARTAKAKIGSYLKQKRWRDALIQKGDRIIDVWNRNYQPVTFYFNSFESIVLYLKNLPRHMKSNKGLVRRVRENLELSPSFKENLGKGEWEKRMLERVERMVE